MSRSPIFFIDSSAPTRICDNGGWTDTWFAEYGTVFNIAIELRAKVRIKVYRREDMDAQIVISAQDYGDIYARELGMGWQKHPLIEAAIEQSGVPDEVGISVVLSSDAPPGASLGTSAAVTVALIGALDCLTPGRLTPGEIARRAHEVETMQLGGQSGVQDQLAAAYGGINYIEIRQFPHARVSPVQPDESIWSELQRRLLVIYIGRPHRSSLVHEMVIDHLQNAGPDEPRLAFLRTTAAPARDALLAGDFKALGQTFIDNTEGQRSLHPGLINSEAQQIIELAQTRDALGWKVNGAGGSGGSVTLLLDGSPNNRQDLIQTIGSSEVFQVIEPRPAREGLRRSVRRPAD